MPALTEAEIEKYRQNDSLCQFLDDIGWKNGRVNLESTEHDLFQAALTKLCKSNGLLVRRQDEGDEYLAVKNAHARDALLQFDEPNHV